MPVLLALYGELTLASLPLTRARSVGDADLDRLQRTVVVITEKGDAS